MTVRIDPADEMTMAVPRILAVDDDPKILSLMRRGLAFAGYAVTISP